MGAINRPFYVKGHFLNTDSGGCVQFWQGCRSGSALVAGQRALDFLVELYRGRQPLLSSRLHGVMILWL